MSDKKIKFTYVGTLAPESWEAEAGQEGPEVLRCERCMALVLTGDTDGHTAYHTEGDG